MVVADDSSARLAVVVVGAGAIGAIHARCVLASDRMTLAGIVTRSGTAAVDLSQRLTAEFGAVAIALFTSLEDALETLHPDLVSICTPPSSHLQLASIAVAAGAHVLIEKPIALTLAEGQAFLQLDETAMKRGLRIGVVSQHRLDPSAQVVYDLLQSGSFGQLVGGDASIAWWRGESYFDSAAWRGTWAADGGGALMNQGIHVVDLLLSFLGDPIEIVGYVSTAAHAAIEVEDNAVAAIRFQSGALATLRATTAAYPGVESRLNLNGTRGSASIVNDVLTYLHVADEVEEIDPFGLNGEGNRVPEQSAAPYVDATRSIAGHARALDDFVDAIQFGRTPSSTVRTAVAAMATVHAVYISASTGAPVEFAEVLDGAFEGWTPASQVSDFTGNPAERVHR
jgi:predicted dehydrogenase